MSFRATATMATIFDLPAWTSLSKKSLSTGLCFLATIAPTNRQARIAALPPAMKLLPRHWPDWRVNGARPTSAAICLRESRPSSGNSANSVREITGPTPGTDCSRASCNCHTGEPRMQSSISNILIYTAQLSFQSFEQPTDTLGDSGRHALFPLPFCPNHGNDLATPGN